MSPVGPVLFYLQVSAKMPWVAPLVLEQWAALVSAGVIPHDAVAVWRVERERVVALPFGDGAVEGCAVCDYRLHVGFEGRS